MRKTLCILTAGLLTLVGSEASFAQDMTFFITSEGPGNGGDLGGIEGADAHCQALAEAAGAGDKTWVAYLGTELEDGRGVDARPAGHRERWQPARGGEARPGLRRHGGSGRSPAPAGDAHAPTLPPARARGRRGPSRRRAPGGGAGEVRRERGGARGPRRCGHLRGADARARAGSPGPRPMRASALRAACHPRRRQRAPRGPGARGLRRPL